MRSSVSPLSVVILTFNEERNLDACLSSVVDLASEVFVVDSGSTDRTAAIAATFGAHVVTHPFESHAKQWQWALSTLPLTSTWVLALDADQALTPELRAEHRSRHSAVDRGRHADRARISIDGRSSADGGFATAATTRNICSSCFDETRSCSIEDDLVDHHFHVTGPTAILEGDLIEDNRNENAIAVWIEKHNRYAVRQAREEAARSADPDRRPTRAFGSPDERTRWRKRIWNRLPLYARPFGYFLYRYVLRLGFLDGKEGFIFHFMQAFWYRLLVDINRDELRASRSDPSKVAEPAAAKD